nr:exosortase A [uncultured Roseateles sp.]
MNAGWRQVLPALLLLLGAVFWAYRDTLLAMVGIWWRSETFAHAMVVPPISLWLIWRRRQALSLQQPQPAPWFLLPIACVALVWLLGDLVAVNALTQLALVGLLVLSVPALLGLQTTGLILFPLGFLFFAVPMGEFLMPQLMAWTADFTVLALRLSGIPVYREGLQFVIPSGSWSVVEACSGIRYLIASLMVGTLFGYLNYRSLRRRLIFVAISALVPLVANWLRAYLIVMLGHLSSNKLATGADHLIYGWLFFGLIMVLMFMIGSRWAEPDGEADLPGQAVAGPASGHKLTTLWSVALVAGLLVLMPRLALWSLEGAEPVGEPRLHPLTQPAGDWRPSTQTWVDWAPAFQNPSASLRQSFAKNGREVGLHLDYYRHQDYQHKLVSSENKLVRSNNPQWAQVSAGTEVLRLDDQTSLSLNAVELRGSAIGQQASEHRLVVRQLYWVNGQWTDNAIKAKAFGAWYRLLGRGDDGASVVFYTERDSTDGAQAALDSFVRENLHLVEAQLRKTRDNE